MEETGILWPGPLRWPAEKGLIGPKAASLCTLRRLRLRIPPCFFVTTAAFKRHLDADGLRSQLRMPQERLEEIRKDIVRLPMAEDLREEITSAYHRLGAGVVAVRSSATAEDLPGHSFAGQYETILGVTSQEECLDAVKRCWASLWTERAYEYRRRNGIDHGQVEMAVIVQEQIEPDAAGVAFSLDPIKGSRSRIVIEACAGLGEALVSGRVQPDRFILRKKDLGLIRQEMSGDEPSMDLRSAQRLARCVRRIERKLGNPQDVEWAIRDGRIWFLQARPITAIPMPKSWEDRQVWSNTNTGEVVPDVMTPVTWSMIQLLFQPLFRSFLRLVGVDANRAPVAGLVAGRVYFNVNTALAAGRPFGLGPDNVARFEGVFGGDHMREYRLGQIDISEEDLPDMGFCWPGYILSWPRIVYDLLTHSPKRGQKARARLKVRNDALRGLDLEAMDTADLAKTFRGSLWNNTADVDLLYLVTSAPAILVFDKVCRDWLGDPDLHLGYRLLAAQGGMADTEAGLDLWRIAEGVHADTETETAVLSDLDWKALQVRLNGTEGGRRLLAAWDRFMTEHGHHCRGELEFFNTRWSERPDYVLGWLRSSLRSIGTINPLERHRRLAAERDELTGQCLQRLRNPIKRRLFARSLRRVQRLAVDRENWKNEIIRQLAALRRILLVLGARFQRKGLFSNTDDVFFLELSEIESLAQGRVPLDVGQWIAERRAEYERNIAFTPPPVVVGRFDPNKYIDSRIEAGVKELKGIAVSPGVVSGKARVILRTDDHQHVEAGEILVAPFTDPAWTPYFLPAAGVVMDQGGVLSHGAIIAREYGIPAVVNVGPATQIIRTGQRIQVDGDRGMVTILEETAG
jgi:phosphohistidine swiveling domain-containing protein